jgi:uncharacterized protein YdbL (DUF1318 family)
MANSITTKYGTKINVTGLTPEQIKKVRSIAGDNGAYGSKGAALADQLRKQAAKAPAAGAAPAPAQGGGAFTPAPTTPAPTGPTVNPGPSIGEQVGFTPQAPLPNDSLGGFNSKGGAFEDTTGLFNSAPKIPGATDLAGDINKVRDANYQYLSRDFASNKAQEIEAARQDLAQRGIPFDPNPQSLYGRTMKQLEQKYGDLDMQAKQQAIIGGDSSFSTQVGAADTANQAFYRGVFGLTDAELNKYNIDENTRVALKKIAADRASQKEQIARSGGGSQQETGIIMGGGIAP